MERFPYELAAAVANLGIGGSRLTGCVPPFGQLRYGRQVYEVESKQILEEVGVRETRQEDAVDVTQKLRQPTGDLDAPVQVAKAKGVVRVERNTEIIPTLSHLR